MGQRDRRSTIADVEVVELPKVFDPRGNLTFVEGTRHIPFDIRRVFYLYDVPGGESRAATRESKS